MKKPFTDKEQKIIDLLVEAHNNYVELDENIPTGIDEWVTGIHGLQYLLSMRVLRRDYPDTFKSDE